MYLNFFSAFFLCVRSSGLVVKILVSFANPQSFHVSPSQIMMSIMARGLNFELDRVFVSHPRKAQVQFPLVFDVIEKGAVGRCQLEGEISRKIWRTRTKMQLNLTRGGKGLFAIVIRLFDN